MCPSLRNWLTDAQTHRHTDTQTHRHTDRQTQSLTDGHKLHYNQKQISTCVGKIKVLKKKTWYKKTIFASNFDLAMVVLERVLQRQFQGLFKSGPKSCTYNLKIRAN